MTEPTVVYRTIKYSNGVPHAVTNHAFARRLGFPGPVGTGTGQIRALRIGFSANRQELYVRAYSPGMDQPLSYRFLESGAGELLRLGIQVGDEIPLTTFFELLNGGHLYTDKEGLTPKAAPSDRGVIGEYDFGPDVQVIDLQDGDPAAASPATDEESDAPLTAETLRMLTYQTFGEMMYNLAQLQQWGGDLHGLNEGADEEAISEIDPEDQGFFERFIEHRTNMVSFLDEMIRRFGVDELWTLSGK